MTIMKHKHHIIPKHDGGTDDPSNLIEVSVEEHAELHFDLYLTNGKLQDWAAFHLLAGLGEEGEKARLMLSHTPEANRKRSLTQTGVPIHGGRRSEEDKRKISEGTKRAMAKMEVKGRPPKSVKFGDKNYTTMKECAKDLGIHLITAYRWRSEGRIQ